AGVFAFRRPKKHVAKRSEATPLSAYAIHRSADLLIQRSAVLEPLRDCVVWISRSSRQPEPSIFRPIPANAILRMTML
ncbi:TPA: hypothetical protein ACQ7VA_003685, partial [Burkholderia sola]